NLLRALLTSDPQLAKAYGLGRALSDTCHMPQDSASLKSEFNPYRLATLGESLADLASLFPSHASRSVRLSLSAWRRWAVAPKVNTQEARRAVPAPTTSASDGQTDSASSANDQPGLFRKKQALEWGRDGA